MLEIVVLKKQLGEYLAFIDSDDFIHKDYVKTLYELCKKYKCHISECDFENWYNNNQNIEIEQPELIETVHSSDEKIKKIYGAEHIRSIVAWNKLYKRELFENVKYAYGKINEDEFTTYKLFDKADRIVDTNQKLYYYAYSPNSIMRRKFDKRRLDYLEALEERLKFFKEKNKKELYQLTKSKYCYTLIEFYHRVKKDIEESKNIQKDLKRKLRKNVVSVMFMKYIPLKHKIKLCFGCIFQKIYCKKYLKI